MGTVSEDGVYARWVPDAWLSFGIPSGDHVRKGAVTRLLGMDMAHGWSMEMEMEMEMVSVSDSDSDWIVCTRITETSTEKPRNTGNSQMHLCHGTQCPAIEAPENTCSPSLSPDPPSVLTECIP